MRRTVWLRYLVALLLLWVGTLAILVAMVGARERDARGSERAQFRVRATLAGQLLGTNVENLHTRELGWAEAILSDETVTTDQLRLACTTMAFEACGVFDSGGVVLVTWPYAPELIGQNLSLPQVSDALRTGGSSEGPVQPSRVLESPIVPLGQAYGTPYGRRVLVGVVSVQGGSLATSLSSAVALPTSEIVILDASGVVASRWPGEMGAEIVPLSDIEPALAARLGQTEDGGYANRYYASAPVPGTDWTVIATVENASLYRPVRDLVTATWWLVGGAGALALVIFLALVSGIRRRMQMSVELQRLAAAQADHDARLRNAREVNDTIVQGLVAAEMASDLGDAAESRRLLGRASRDARHWIGEQLGLAEDVTPGSLVRTRPADEEFEEAAR